MGIPMDRSRRVFLKSGPFQKAFPKLESAVVEYSEYRPGGESAEGYRRMHDLRTYGGLLPCGNPLCRRGGYELDLKVHEMVRNAVDVQEFTLSCRGDEGSAKGRKRGRRCDRCIKARAKLVFKQNPPSAPSSAYV